MSHRVVIYFWYQIQTNICSYDELVIVQVWNFCPFLHKRHILTHPAREIENISSFFLNDMLACHQMKYSHQQIPLKSHSSMQLHRGFQHKVEENFTHIVISHVSNQLDYRQLIFHRWHRESMIPNWIDETRFRSIIYQPDIINALLFTSSYPSFRH